MGFLAPWFLAGAAAIGLPLWIHLLRQYRSTPHPFSSLMFFEQRTQSSIKHRRLRYLLLLSLRVALLILLALAFANPFVSRTAASVGGRKMLIIAVDNSFSMRYGNHLDRAKQVALSAVSNLNSRRARSGPGSRLARAFHDATGGGSRSAQGRHSVHPAVGRTQLIWRAGARFAHHRAIGAHSPRSASGERYAEVIASARIRRSAPGPGHEPDLSFRGRFQRAQLAGGERDGAGENLRPQESARAGRHCQHRRIRESPAHRFAGVWTARCWKASRWKFHPTAE